MSLANQIDTRMISRNARNGAQEKANRERELSGHYSCWQKIRRLMGRQGWRPRGDGGRRRNDTVYV